MDLHIQKIIVTETVDKKVESLDIIIESLLTTGHIPISINRNLQSKEMKEAIKYAPVGILVYGIITTYHTKLKVLA